MFNIKRHLKMTAKVTIKCGAWGPYALSSDLRRQSDCRDMTATKVGTSLKLYLLNNMLRNYNHDSAEKR